MLRLRGYKLSCAQLIPTSTTKTLLFFVHTVRKMDLILRSIERRPQMQFSMARRFMLQLLRRYNVKFCKMLNFQLQRFLTVHYHFRPARPPGRHIKRQSALLLFLRVRELCTTDPDPFTHTPGNHTQPQCYLSGHRVYPCSLYHSVPYLYSFSRLRITGT
jgi:hypothetical protein